MHWVNSSSVIKSANWNALLELKKAEVYLPPLMETLTNAARTSKSKSSPKVSPYSVALKALSYLVGKNSVLPLHVPSSASLRFLFLMRLHQLLMRRVRRKFRLLLIT